MKAFKSANRNLPLLPDLIIEEIISYASWNDLLVWSQVSAFCFRIASRRIWSHLRLHDRALVSSKKCRSPSAEFMINEEKLIKNLNRPLKGLADHGKQAFPINIRGACVTQFTLSMATGVAGFRIDYIIKTLLPAIPFMTNLVLFDWDACRPPSRDMILALVGNCNELATFRCIPRRSEFSREVQMASGRYSNFDGLECLHDLKEISVRVRGATAAFRLCGAIKNSPALSTLSMIGPHELDDVLNGLPDKKLPALTSLTIDNVIMPNGQEGQDKLLRALDPSSYTLKELTIEPCPGLSNPNFLKRTIFPNVVSFKYKYQTNHYPAGREPDILEAFAQFIDVHDKLSKVRIERLSNENILPLPSSLLEAFSKPERQITALALNAVDVSLDDLEVLVKKHGKHLTNFSFFSSHVPLGQPTYSTFRAALKRFKGKKHVMETNLRESGIDTNANVGRLVHVLGAHAANLLSLQIYHSSSNLRPLGTDGPVLNMYRFKDIYQERSRERMRYLADKLPQLQFAGDWKVLTWYIERGQDGRATRLVDVDRVASHLEMGEMEESVLEKTFSWYGKFAGRRPWEGKLTTRRYQ